MLIARDGGCTKPGCTVPAYGSQVHHADRDWANDGQTNVDELGLACGPDNRMVGPGGWETGTNEDNDVEWIQPIPPPALDTGLASTITIAPSGFTVHSMTKMGTCEARTGTMKVGQGRKVAPRDRAIAALSAGCANQPPPVTGCSPGLVPNGTSGLAPGASSVNTWWGIGLQLAFIGV
jgi:hypothetical protein